MEELSRSFICIDFPDEIIKEVARIQELIKTRKFTGKLTELENLHLTLKFLGEISSQKLNEIQEKLKEIKFKPMELKLGETGIFSLRGNPKIIWIKILGKEIHELQKNIDNVLSGSFKKEERFMSHMTIARIRYIKDKIRFKEYIEKIKPQNINFKISSFKLKKSELRPIGPVYTTINEFSPQ